MKTVLLVEDNDLNRQIIRAFIEINEYTPVSASSAEEALEILKETVPDLILMDIMLPGIDGITAVRRIKADPRWQGIPVLAMSAYSMREDIDNALKAGCSDYIVKPAVLKVFSQTINKYLQP